ncbi:hypothetical protein L0B70_04600 [Kaistella sp. 97-N-M2]|uniref:hypothetical protein n=1 Tax=Kaistella sp. 97-N-M2 TaxID=2908645 RepID=UPI001F18658B|nr:hypothetical protein [Kaistella sp. 97-N-M2]UJF30672.1 hypothetical protein L0B70_04600 [Kaistella sp. 97-N-M2]
MRILLLCFFGFSTFLFGQKKKYKLDVVSNIEAKAIMMKALGNNSLAKDLQPFYGFGFSGNLMTPINFGLGVDYNMLFSNVRYDRQNIYGNIGSPKMTVIDVFLTHRENISEEFLVEEMAGFSYYNHSSSFIALTDEKLKNSGMGFNLGGKAIYILDPEGYQAVFVAGKFNYYSTNIYNENADIQKYFNHSAFLRLSLGYRYNF